MAADPELSVPRTVTPDALSVGGRCHVEGYIRPPIPPKYHDLVRRKAQEFILNKGGAHWDVEVTVHALPGDDRTILEAMNVHRDCAESTTSRDAHRATLLELGVRATEEGLKAAGFTNVTRGRSQES